MTSHLTMSFAKVWRNCQLFPFWFLSEPPTKFKQWKIEELKVFSTKIHHHMSLTFSVEFSLNWHCSATNKIWYSIFGWSIKSCWKSYAFIVGSPISLSPISFHWYAFNLYTAFAFEITILNVWTLMGTSETDLELTDHRFQMKWKFHWFPIDFHNCHTYFMNKFTRATSSR